MWWTFGDPGIGSTATMWRAATGTSPTPGTASGESAATDSDASRTRNDLHHTSVLPSANSALRPGFSESE